MCGRYGIADVQHIGERFRFSLDLDLTGIAPRYQAAPTQRLPVITERDGQRQLAVMAWGFLPSWAKDRTRPLINARAESIQEKPTFRTAFRQTPCLIPATHFFEWQAIGKEKRPYLIRPTDQALFAFAGISAPHADPSGGERWRFAIITTVPNELMAPIHNRMPVILRPEQEAVWLDVRAPASERQSLLGPYAAAAMEARPVERLVNPAAPQR